MSSNISTGKDWKNRISDAEEGRAIFEFLTRRCVNRIFLAASDFYRIINDQ